MYKPTLTPKSTLSAIVLPMTGSDQNSLVNQSVPYKIYSDENSSLYSSQFLSGAVDQVSYVYKKLGGDILDLEITQGNVYAAYEEAVLEYSYIVNLHQATNVLSDALGNTTGSFDSKGVLMSGSLSGSLSGSHVALKYPKFDYSMARRVGEGLASEIGLNSSVQYSASFDVNPPQQEYDLQQIITSQSQIVATGSVTITDIAKLANDDQIKIIAADKTEIVAKVAASSDTTDKNNVTFILGGSKEAAATNLATVLDLNTKIKASASGSVVTITQVTPGSTGNTDITLTDAGDAGMSKSNFSGGITYPYTSKDIAGRKILIKKVYYKTPHAMWRFFGYYGGLNVVGNLHNYGQFSDDSTFQLIPAWQNKAQAMAFEDAIYTRMSHFSYELRNNKIRLSPIPYTGGPRKMWVEFSIPEDVWESEDDKSVDGVNNMNTLPIGNLPYENINSIGKQWIRRFALALCKETLGQVRSKFSSVPIPGEAVTLNGTALLSEAKEEQNKLRDELKETLAQLTYTKMAEQDANMLENTEKVLEKVPNYIFVG